MKTIKRISALLFVLMLAASFLPVFASSSDGEWRSDLRRMNDLSKVLPAEDSDELNEAACSAVEQYMFDFVLITYDSSMRGDDTEERYIEYLYENNSLGYGESHDGVAFAINTDSKCAVALSHGRGTAIFDANGLKNLANHAIRGYEELGYKGAFTAFLSKASEEVAGSYVSYDDDGSDIYGDESVTVLIPDVTELDLPSWYPLDRDSWVWTPAPDGASRVIDEAELFSDDEEALLKQRIAETTAAYNADIVVVTVPSTGSFSHMDYADDYYDYNGFGVGPEHDGFLLLICMDSSHRGGWCTVTGTRPRKLYTEENANALDDVLYDFLGSAEYFEGVYDWVENIGTLLDKGIPFAPEWYPSANENHEREHDANAPRIVDEVKALTAEQLEKLEQKRRAISEKYGVDIVIDIPNGTYGLGRSNYKDAFYKFNGYGYGENYDGIMLTLFGSERPVMSVYGNPSDKLTERNIELLEDGSNVKNLVEDKYGAIDRWLNYLDKTLKTGRVPRTPGVWTIRSLVAAAISAIFSHANVSSAKKTMKTVRKAYDANEHLVPGTLAVERLEDRFTHDTVSKVYSPVNRGSSSSGGGGHSSYSGGHSSSSGSSHSGSGRSF